MNKSIAVIRGDGIGPEIVGEAIRVLDAVAAKFGHTFTYHEAPMGGNAIDAFGVPLPDSSLETCLSCDSVLLGAVGGPKWDAQPPANRPERGLLRLRSAMGLYTNIRPARMFADLSAACPLRSDIAARGIDFVVVRDCSRLWRRVVTEVAAEYPDVELLHMYVDNAAMQIVRDPSQFDVIVTENLFGDILSDEASQITGSIGMIPSSSMGEGTRGLYEPIHGSAPDIAGQDKANPIGTILAAAMMLRYSFDMAAEADAVEAAVDAALKDGCRCGDIAQGGAVLGCRAMGEAICQRI